MLKSYNLTPLKLETNDLPYAGISMLNGMQQYPTTPTLLRNVGFGPNVIRQLTPTTLDINVEGLRVYQQEDVAKLLPLKNAGCFNEPRTGKTVTSLIVFKEKRINKFLVVCPSSAMYQWQNEIERWTNYNCIVLKGTADKRKKLLNSWKDGALIISYDSLKEKSYKNKEGEYSHTLGDILDIKKIKNIEGIIVDEAHRIRNKKTNTNDAIYELRKIPNKLVLSGTPVLKEPIEIYAILNFLYPKLFKSFWQFRAYYFEEYERTIYTARGKQITKDVGPLKREQEMIEFLDRMSTSRKRKDVMPWLPEKDRQYIYLPLTTEQDRYLTELRKYFETEHIITKGILDTLIRERQICNSPSLVGLRGGSPKTEWLLDYLKDYPNKYLIVFSKFTAYLEELAAILKTDCMITGKIDSKQCNQNKINFQEGKERIILINIDAGKEALTLDRADVIVFMDAFPPVGDITQAEDRFISTTEDKANKEHTIFYLVMKDSYEEKIIESLKQSKEETDVINDYKNYLGRLKN